MLGIGMNMERIKNPVLNSHRVMVALRLLWDDIVQPQKDDDSEPGYETSSGGHWGRLSDGWLSHSAAEHSGGWVLTD